MSNKRIILRILEQYYNNLILANEIRRKNCKTLRSCYCFFYIYYEN